MAFRRDRTEVAAVAMAARLYRRPTDLKQRLACTDHTRGKGGLVFTSKRIGAPKAGSTSASNPRYDWLEPWWHLLELCNILMVDAVGIVCIVGVARIVELSVSIISPHTPEWKVLTATITLSDIINYGDLGVVVAFFVVVFRHIVIWVNQ